MVCRSGRVGWTLARQGLTPKLVDKEKLAAFLASDGGQDAPTDMDAGGSALGARTWVQRVIVRYRLSSRSTVTLA